jgi:tetratricopeptide (TPR) repeat protein
MRAKKSVSLGLIAALLALTSCSACNGILEASGLNDPANVSMPPPSPTPEIYRPLVNKAVDANEAGHYDEARQRYNDIIGKDPTSAEADFCRAEIARIDSKYQEAIKYFDVALAKNPRLETAYNDRGNAYRCLGLEDKAISDYSVAMLLGPGPVHWLCRAHSYLAKKEFFKAMQDATVAINKDKNYAVAYEARGEAWEGLKNLQAAQVDFDKSIEVSQNSPRFLCCRGQFYLRHDKLELARADLAAAANEAKSDGDYYYWLGQAHLALQDLEKAKADFTRYKELSLEAHLADEVETADRWLTRVQTYQYDLTHKPEEHKYQWAIACSAQLFSQNHDGLWSLSGDEPTEANIQSEKKLLLDWWDISSREELLKLLESQLQYGHNSSWQAHRAALKQVNPVESLIALLHDSDNAAQVPVRLDLVRQYGEKFGDRGLLAWDLCRYISLCRWGYRVGWLSEEEAYERIMPVARRLQANYSSWQMGNEYLIGRHFWNAELYEADREKSEEILGHLLKWPKGPWVSLSWNTKLD